MHSTAYTALRTDLSEALHRQVRERENSILLQHKGGTLSYAEYHKDDWPLLKAALQVQPTDLQETFKHTRRPPK